MSSSVRTALRREKLEPAALEVFVAAPERGATAAFVGLVRDLHDGRRVVAVSYDAFEPLAVRVLGAIAAEASERFGACVAVEHRIGKLSVGDASVAIAAGTPHRAEAFDACRYVIEEIKRRLPVWKREHYVDGDSAWLSGCALTPPR
ncbi:MAG: molybdenum cofactor biosynthesis protein MoaE [Elusimicrobia bacterium]|nr:molybdenum cofactor biosynthesis protein MoaE [Elusimicrobiota bacterium]